MENKIKTFDEYIEMVYQNPVFDKISEHRQKRFSESSELESENFVVEGIEIDGDNFKIRLNDSDKGVDFERPIYWEDRGMSIISIFKRTKVGEYRRHKDMDGNPFIHALKGNYDWEFDITPSEKSKYLKKFIENCDKLQKQYDTIIMIPSKSKLNESFMEFLYKRLNAKYKIKDVFRKMSINHDEIEQFINYDELKKEPNYKKIRKEIEDILEDLNGTQREFSAKEIDKKYLKYFKFLSKNEDVNYVELISDKNVLILDDLYSSGSTISQAVDAIKQNYEPKSITVVTLLSKVME